MTPDNIDHIIVAVAVIALGIGYFWAVTRR